MKRAEATAGPTAAQLLDYDIERVRKMRAKAVDGGAVHQSWSRILEALELAKLAQDAVAEQSR